jgi:MoaA/NifB/PqqE/SkfB family radical SAM enzyme
MVKNELKNRMEQQIIQIILNNLTNTSDKNIIRMASLVEKVSPKYHKPTIKNIKNLFEQKHPSIGLVRNFLTNLNPKYKEQFTKNLINNFLINQKTRKEFLDAGQQVPFTILISPTMRCNLNCVGCYARDYSKKDDLDFEVIDRILTEAKEMGVAFFTILGGEPFIRNDVFELYKKHPDALFQVYTNGTLINEEGADKLSQIGNVIPMISIEGFEKETDQRRGKGTYQKIMKAMDLLQNRGIPFGTSVAVTKLNEEIVTGDKFIDMLIDKGAYINWFFLYMPVGRKPDLSLMPTPEQRKHLLERGRYIRANKPLFIIDFWNDAPYVGGCIAGKEYIHITSKGDVEPCIFTHFAVDNIKNKSLKEVMDSEYFKEIRKRQPFSENLLLPCMWIDHPKVSREIYEKLKIYPTHPGAEDILIKDEFKQGLDCYSKQVNKIYSKIWDNQKTKP